MKLLFAKIFIESVSNQGQNPYAGTFFLGDQVVYNFLMHENNSKNNKFLQQNI